MDMDMDIFMINEWKTFWEVDASINIILLNTVLINVFSWLCI